MAFTPEHNDAPRRSSDSSRAFVMHKQHTASNMMNGSQEMPSDHLTIPEREGRNSFSSIKEDVEAGIAQSFTISKTSSFARLGSLSSEYAVDDEDDDDESNDLHQPEPKASSSFRRRAEMLMPSFIIHRPHDNLDGSEDVVDVRGWKHVSIRGKTQSRSFGDLKSAWNSLTHPLSSKKDEMPAAKLSPLESLPTEILTKIISHLALDIPPANYGPRNTDLIALLLTSTTIHRVTLSILYRSITIPHSSIYSKFLRQISAPDALPLAHMVRRLDFSHFNPTQSGLTARERRELQNLTADTLFRGLELMENLQEFLGQEHIEDDISAPVLLKLLTGLPRLQALDLCGSSSVTFRNAFTSVINGSLPDAFSITRLSLHECAILPSIVFEKILPRLVNLTHLDVSHTRINDEALMSIPNSARITHLNLSKCSGLSGAAVTEFLTTHPAIVGDRQRRHPGLVYLNLRVDAKTHSLLSSSDLTTLLPALPTTLRSLNLSGSKMSSSATDNTHINALLPLTKHLEELSLGRNIPLSAVNQIFSTAQISTCTLRYIDISDLGVMEGVSVASLLDKQNCYLLRNWSLPLEVVEVSEKVGEMCRVRGRGVEREGWRVMEAGRRYWLVRDMRDVAGATVNVTVDLTTGVANRLDVHAAGVNESESGDHVLGKEKVKKDEGGREWKMGATYWGMRKVPVARMEVGGMYGLYMFKR